MGPGSDEKDMRTARALSCLFDQHHYMPSPFICSLLYSVGTILSRQPYSPLCQPLDLVLA